jgi:hypothetical protein
MAKIALVDLEIEEIGLVSLSENKEKLPCLRVDLTIADDEELIDKLIEHYGYSELIEKIRKVAEN